MSADPPRPPETLAPLLVMRPDVLNCAVIWSNEAKTNWAQALGYAVAEIAAQRAALATVTQEKLTLAAITERADRRASAAIERAEQADADLATARAALARVQAFLFHDYGCGANPIRANEVAASIRYIAATDDKYCTCGAREAADQLRAALTADAAARSGKE